MSVSGSKGSPEAEGRRELAEDSKSTATSKPRRIDATDSNAESDLPGDDSSADAEAQEIVDEEALENAEVDETVITTVEVDLGPEPEPEPDEIEQAIAIEIDPVIDPVRAASALNTTSIDIDGEDVATPVELNTGVVPLPDDTPAFSRRGRLRGDTDGLPEPAAMLTAERLLEPHSRHRPRPQGWWPSLVYTCTFGLLNLGDSARVRAEKDVDARINQPLDGGAKFVPVLTRKGGVGKTTITTLLGQALASAREDRVIAIDANPDRGTLSERVPKQTRSTVRDVVARATTIKGFTDFSAFVSRDATRLDVLASDTDPLLSEAFSDIDYEVVASLAAQYYSLVLTDCGTGIVHSVMSATLKFADELVIISGGSIDEARLASETLTWLESNGYAALVKNAVVAINTATQGTSLVRVDEIEAHFLSRVRAVVRIPYDSHLAAGSAIDFANLNRKTRESARELAALVIDGLV